MLITFFDFILPRELCLNETDLFYYPNSVPTFALSVNDPSSVGSISTDFLRYIIG